MKTVILLLFAATTAFTYWLRHINLRHLKRYGTEVPPGFVGAVDREKLLKASAYTLDSSRVGLWESLFDNLLVIVFLFGGLLVHFDGVVSSLTASPLLQPVLFFLLLTFGLSLLSVPFDIYRTFVVEARHGFNKTTPALWFSDFLKSQVISALVMALLVAAAFWLMRWSPDHWWLWVWGLLAFFTLFMMYISPYLIEPLFNSFEPVQDPELESDIRSMMEKAGLQVGQVQQVDSSRRSSHSNAYFTGIGRVKRIVLYDTLIAQMTRQEIVAVLAHEIGHWKRGHVWKRLVVAELMAFLAAWAVYHLLQWPGLTELLGLPGDLSVPARLLLIGFLASLLFFPLSPWSAWRSRCQEREADRFASELTGCPQNLAAALVKLSSENLSNLFPHPFYAAWYYSHPPVVERVQTLLRWAEQQGVAETGTMMQNRPDSKLN